MGRHYGPWPGPTLQAFLAQGNLFASATRAFGSHQVAWASAYPDGFFRALEQRKLRLNAPAHAAREAGIDLPTLDAYQRGDALAADLDGAYFASQGVMPPEGHRAGPEGAHTAGVRLARLAADHAFTFFDVWTTDRAGHDAEFEAARNLVQRLDALLAGVLAAGRNDLTLVVTSDHGNLEDLRHGRHTTARVPLLAFGPEADALQGACSIVDVAPAIQTRWNVPCRVA